MPRILIAEDDKDSQALIRRILEKEDYHVTTADDGLGAWEIFQSEDFRLVITDWVMPRMNGLELCKRIRESDETPGYVYIIIVTSKEEKEDVIQAMDAGANDYITKPYDRGELLARVRSGQRIIDLEESIREKNLELSTEKEKSEKLLLSIFPGVIADQLRKEQKLIADSFPDATVLFAGVDGFPNITANRTPIEVVQLLGEIFSIYDRLAEEHGLEKIKTMGDTYMAAGGVPTRRRDHAEAVAEMALAMQEEAVRLDAGTGQPLRLRIGIDTGPVIAGVIGTGRLAYDLWGETVDTAAEMKTSSVPGAIQVTASTYGRLQDRYLFEERGEFYVRGKGAVRTYLLIGRQA
jgi:class 3 adenylate cyclase